MTALMTLLPGNSSRTRSQARIVPKNPLRTTTISEQTSVSFRLFTASGEVTCSQKWPRPREKASLATAASGSSTMMLR